MKKSPTGGIASVYNAQCVTWALAKQALKVSGDAIRCDFDQEMRSPDPLFQFHARREYRSDAANTLRRLVAFRVRMNRRIFGNPMGAA